MYDKVKLWIDRGSVGEFFPSIPQYLDEANGLVDLKTGEERVYGYVGGLKVSIQARGVYMIGSLPKFLFGSNAYTLDMHTTKEALQKLADTLHIDVNQAKVTGLEFGTNFIMRYSVGEYLQRLGSIPRLQREHIGNSLYYKGTGKKQPKVLCFYDKQQQLEDTGKVVPDGLGGSNMLRYEVRLNGRLRERLKQPEVLASSLADPDVYKLLVKLYQDNYFSIKKSKQAKYMNKDQIKTPKDAYDVFVARLVSNTPQDQISSYIEELKRDNVFEDAKYYTRVKNKLQDVLQKTGAFVPDDLIKELDAEIRNVGAYI